MIRKIWFVRNKYRLYTHLSYAVNIFILFYSTLTMVVIENPIGIRFDSTGKVIEEGSKYWIILIPLIGLIVNILISLIMKSNLRFNFMIKLTENNNQLQNNISKEAFIGLRLLFSILFSFIQVNFLNAIKGLPSFSWFPIIILILMIICYSIYMLIKSFKNK